MIAIVILYISVIIFNLIALRMKKKLEWIDYYASIFFGLFAAELADRFTDKYDMYGFFNPYFIEVKTLWVLLGIYPAATMMIINWYPYSRSWIKKIFYIIGWSIFSTFYEYLSLKAGFLYHHKWNLWYSAFSYPFLYAMLFLNLRFFHWLKEKGKQE
ncbi:CBO0543 family protein [Priestia megaterium]|uniref:CBO0543 family protein n=1 Tax=Priestia megaterium TaxID=1404 RepID=UPI00272F89B4|nr:CBO0543 family protein [Priestia megaterium]MDP1442536.1 CBO0543 family protein [Priestia megaterium]MDP1471627.1 CBO0543 family protein [Priestia megaterium]MDR0132238.1 CBO0543 family protein [Priestia megaterium]